MRETLRQNKGITLIALVITIIVLLILAGIAIAALTGDNGILSRATDARAANALGEAKDKCALIVAEETEKFYKDAYVTQTGTAEVEALDTTIVTALNAQKSTLANGVEATITGTGTDATIELKYTETNATATGTISGGVINWTGANYSGTASSDPEDSQSGGSGGGAGTGITGLTDMSGNAITASSLTTVGQDFKIGNEQFRVLNPDKDGKVVAMPYYNITLPADLSSEAPVQSGSAGITKFVNTESDVTWSAGADIDMENTNNLVQQYITAYSNTLPTGVTARIARLSEVIDSAITLPDGATVTKAQIRNPGQSGDFWLGSAHSRRAGNVYSVIFTRRHPRLRV